MKKRTFTDIHHHILYGLDDGATSPKEMLAMLKLAIADGIRRIVTTPHITPGLQRFDLDKWSMTLENAQALCRDEGLDIELYEGAEILYTQQTCNMLRDGMVPTLAGTNRVLVEFMPNTSYAQLYRALDDLLSYGYRPIVAHVERYNCLTLHPIRLEQIKEEMDVCYQVNCSSIISRRDIATRRFVTRMLDEDLLDAIATDAHRANMRTVHMREAWQAISWEYGVSYANELTDGHLVFGEDKQ